MNTHIKVSNLNVFFKSKKILDNLSFELQGKTVTSVLGPSGIGKSTLLRSLNRLIDEEEGFSSSGEIFLNNKEITKEKTDKNWIRQKIGIIFQKPVVFPISIYKNVLFGLSKLKLAPKKEHPEIVEKLLFQVGLWDEVKDRLEDLASELSVGQQQRLTIARTLAIFPEVILMDEPTSSLDKVSSEKINELILELKKDKTILLVTHHEDQAIRLSDKVLRLGSGEFGAKFSTV